MAHKKASGATRQHPPREGKRRGIKLFAGQPVRIGGIIVRQKGTVIKAGDNVKVGKDYTLYAMKDGIVDYKLKLGRTYAFVK